MQMFFFFFTKACEDLIFSHLKQLHFTHKVITYSFFAYMMGQENSAHKPLMMCYISSKCLFLFSLQNKSILEIGVIDIVHFT